MKDKEWGTDNKWDRQCEREKKQRKKGRGRVRGDENDLRMCVQHVLVLERKKVRESALGEWL